MKKTNDKVRATGATDTDGTDRLDVDEPGDEMPEPYAEMDEDDGEPTDVAEEPTVTEDEAEAEVRVPMEPPKTGGTRRKRFRVGLRKHRNRSGSTEE